MLYRRFAWKLEFALFIHKWQLRALEAVEWEYVFIKTVKWGRSSRTLIFVKRDVVNFGNWELIYIDRVVPSSVGMKLIMTYSWTAFTLLLLLRAELLNFMLVSALFKFNFVVFLLCKYWGDTYRCKLDEILLLVIFHIFNHDKILHAI